MNTKFTEGPWLVERGLHGSMHIYSGTEPLAEVWMTGPDRSKMLSSAQLMAAAPDLYIALVATLSHLKLFTTEHDTIAKAVWDQAEAALAKAEGRHP